MRAFVRNRKLRCAVGLLAVLAVFVAVGVVFASSGGGESGFDKGKDLIWRIMNFVVLAGGLTFLLRKPVAKGLESRRQGIRDQLDDLEKRKQKAEKELSEYQQKLNQLDKEVEKIVAEYVKDGEALKAKIIEEAKASAEKLQRQAKKNIEHEFEKAKKELRAEMGAQAIVMAEELIKKNINDKDQERIIGEYLEKVVVAQ
ncbi:MAG: F0F1 ATP synthase subunit B [Deltaproteobacteria bacterium]|nr:F0F1 ATP synthase subunit B [Deltaproteobacteria bacterium]MBW2601424.1 F0F1 ATP synthase subunit B [Deltaproteobacteria bacterium]